MKKILCWVVLLSWVALAATSAEEPPNIGPVIIINRGLDQALAREIEVYVRGMMAEKHSPGIAVGIVQGDQTVYEGYFGFANLEDRLAVRESTVFRIGSISKTFTSLGLMQQWEQGKFKLDDEFNSVLPYPVIRQQDPSCSAVTFEHMFTHTSGAGELMSYRQLRHPFLTLSPLPGRERQPLAAVLADGIRPGVCPGVKWSYCNYCFAALGLALESLSGETFQEYTQEHLLQALGMTHSSFYENQEILDNLAQGYHYNEKKGKYERTALWNMTIPPAGNMYSTVPDMARYMIALLNGGANGSGRVVQPETLELMFQTHYAQDERQNALGLCFFKESTLLGTPVLGHNGAVPGFGSAMYIAAEKKFGIIVFGNVMSAPPYEIADGLLKKMLGYKAPENLPPPQREVWPALEGYYGSKAPDVLSDFRFLMSTLGAYQVKAKRDELIITTLRGDKSYPLRQVYAEDPYFYMVEDKEVELPRYITFVPGSDGSVESLITGLNEYVRLEGEDLALVKMNAVLLAFLPAGF